MAAENVLLSSYFQNLAQLTLYLNSPLCLLSSLPLLMSVLKSDKLCCSRHSASKVHSMIMHVLVLCSFLSCGFVVNLNSHDYKCFGILSAPFLPPALHNKQASAGPHATTRANIVAVRKHKPPPQV